MNQTLNVAAYLKENAAALANDIVHEIIQHFDKDIPKWECEQAITVYTEFLRFLGENLLCEEGKVPAKLIKWSKMNAESIASKEGKISMINSRYPPTRLVFIDRLSQICLQLGLPAEETLSTNKRFNYLLDMSINETIQFFEKYTDEIIETQQKEVMELSAPVVPIQDGLAVLPLVGSITTERAKHLLETTVLNIVSLHIQCLIIDFSGVLKMDKVAETHIFEIHGVLRLLGIETIATGIRPDMAQTIVTNGIDLSSIPAYATVKQAIESMD